MLVYNARNPGGDSLDGRHHLRAESSPYPQKSALNDPNRPYVLFAIGTEVLYQLECMAFISIAAVTLVTVFCRNSLDHIPIHDAVGVSDLRFWLEAVQDHTECSRICTEEDSLR